MTLSQALITIDKDNTKKVVISMEKSYKERKPKIEYSPQAINEIFRAFHPLSRVLMFADRYNSAHIVVAPYDGGTK